MLYRYGEVFRTLLVAADLSLVAASWLAAYAIRFHSVFPAPLGVPDFAPHAASLLLLVPLWWVLLRRSGLHEPQRTRSPLDEAGAVLRATALGVLLLVAASFFLRGYFLSRGMTLIFAVLAGGSLVGFRLAGRVGLQALRRRGYNLRYVLVVGGGPLAEAVIERIRAHPELGLRIRGVLSASLALRGRRLAGIPALGEYTALKSVLAQERIDQVILALARDESEALEKVLADLDDEFVTVRFVPDLLQVMTLRSSVDDLDGLPMIALRDTPLVGWAAVGKRVFDCAVAALALVAAAPLLAGIGLAVRVASGRPVLYTQERMGLDGRVFRMIKFRSMHRGAERDGAPAWTAPADPRRTRLGAFLRRTSLDELPQLWNVLRGDMSLVGPRPERPELIEQFRREIPGYMLRHKVKAGLTGWAQVCGWRGNTSLHERLEHDIYYIQNWSLGLDLRILLLTLWRGWLHRNAY